MNLQEAKSFLEQNDVRYVLVQFVKIHGVSTTKAVPVEHFEINFFHKDCVSSADNIVFFRSGAEIGQFVA
jgi:glutamine synthetase